MIKVSTEKSEFHEDHEVVFWDEDNNRTVSPSLIMGLLMNNQAKVIRKYVGPHNPNYLTPLDFDYYIVCDKE